MIPHTVIFNGPKSAFDQFLESENVCNNTISSLSEIVRLVDERRNRFTVQVEGQDRIESEPINIDNLVAYSDEYMSVREHALMNFEAFFSDINIKKIYLHNPPLVLEVKIKASSSEHEYIRHDYKTVNTCFIKELEQSLKNQIVGQLEAKRSILKSLIPQARMEIKKPNVILFYGPSGVGKTETAKILAKTLEGNLFRKQFSMYHSNEFLSYLFGGKHGEKSFAKEILDREANVILLDEFDKAHSTFHSAFYQLFDEGIYEDQNYNVDVEKAVIICTSNYQNLQEVKQHLGDPIFSRFDAHVEFTELHVNEIREVISRELKRQILQLSDKDKSLIDYDLFEDQLLKKAHYFKDVRKVTRTIRDGISAKILDYIIS
ncbi:AAA family ATPase [Curvivirga aplysinae]|uniref:AAA family ATPase n=1 Tax=Curvivirga aplysinae TaxID=2529852 RepID=UPI0012BC8C0F|nr:AAA family ATPase [Curvivirga aplysinae]MTI09443.1 ATP-dependent Clp protease ATP-binding subunit [Curvivirga aplysinae]